MYNFGFISGAPFAIAAAVASAIVATTLQEACERAQKKKEIRKGSACVSGPILSTGLLIPVSVVVVGA